MPRQSRPSELHGLPAPAPAPTASAESAAPAASAASAASAQKRRRPGWPVFGVLVIVVLGAGMTAGAGDPAADARTDSQTDSQNDARTDSRTDARTGARSGAASVDVVAEDRAVALLDLYRREAAAAELLRAHRDVLTGPQRTASAAADASVRLAEARRDVDQALDAVHLLVDPGSTATAYIHAGGHRGLMLTLEEAGRRAQAIALLSSTHDALVEGTIASAAGDTRERLMRSFGLDSQPELRRWARALLAALDAAEPAPDAATAASAGEAQAASAMAAAATARVESLGAWSTFVSAAAPPAREQLHDFLDAMAPDTLAALAGHPVAGPALARLGRRD